MLFVERSGFVEVDRRPHLFSTSNVEHVYCNIMACIQIRGLPAAVVCAGKLVINQDFTIFAFKFAGSFVMREIHYRGDVSQWMLLAKSRPNVMLAGLLVNILVLLSTIL